MSANPTGHYALKPDGLYLQFDRLFHAPIGEVWFSLTNPTAMQAWIGTYTGSPATGGVRFRMTAEQGDLGAAWTNVSILECDAPHRFLADSGPGPQGFRVFCHLVEGGGMTTLTLGQKLQNPADAASIGPGWDYYLDRLAASRAGLELPHWDRYYPAFAPHYSELKVPDGALVEPGRAASAPRLAQ